LILVFIERALGSAVDHQEKLQNFEKIILRHMDSAFTLARWYTWNEDDAKDLVQEGLLRAFRAFDRFQGTDGRAWLFTIIRNLYFSSVTRKTPDSTVFDEEIHTLEESSADPEVLLLRNAESQLMWQAIEKLGPEFREVLVLRELEGLSYKEIAGITETPLGTVMSRLARAREHIRQNMKAEMRKSGVRQKEDRNAVPGQ
jgi:RNA polymerase sigma factor (sigma-70 family)